jgi:gliding motility-associated-like protein
MKKVLFSLISILLLASSAFSQCDLGNYTTALPIPLASYPYTNINGITVSATVVNVNPLTNFNYSCGGNMFTGSSPAWWVNAANASITLDFSVPVCNFTILVNGTNVSEEFYFNSNNGTISLSNFCTNDYVVIGAGNALLCNNAGAASGTIITVNNPAGATQYVLTHNGLGSGSRYTLLDCYVGCQPPANTISCSTADLTYCEGENATIDYVVTGPYLAGNIFTAELSNGVGNFAAPTIIGSVASTTSGSIPCTIPLGSITGTGYRVRVTSSNPVVTGSNNGSNITINAFPSVVANASPTSVCIGGNLTLSGSGATTYTWTGGVSNGVSFAPASTASYTVTGTDAIGCSNTSSISVPVNPLPTVNASAIPGNTICIGDQCTLNGSGAQTYTWTAPVVNNTPFSPAATATYTVTGTDANNCSNTSTIQIVVNPLPILNVNSTPNDSICEGNSVTLVANGASNYTWSGGIQNGIAFSPTSTSTYTVVGIDANSCSNTLTQTITVNPMPFLTLGPDVEFCQGDSVVLNATTANATYQWQNGSPSPTFTAKQTGFYWVSITVGPCVRYDTVQVIVNQYPIINLGIDTAICAGKSMTLDATCPNCTYTWNDNSTSSTLFVETAGTYSVTATNKGCSSTDEIEVDIIPLPIVNLGLDTAICKGESILLDVSRPGGKYLWQDMKTSPKYTINDFGTYWVDVTVGNCTNRDEIVVSNSHLCNCPVLLPNAFSPNGDLRNDIFKLINANYIDIIQFSIYNRWGEEVFSSRNPTIGWEGDFKGNPCEVGTYHYVVRYTCLYTGKTDLLKGDVTLVR